MKLSVRRRRSPVPVKVVLSSLTAYIRNYVVWNSHRAFTTNKILELPINKQRNMIFNSKLRFYDDEAKVGDMSDNM